MSKETEHKTETEHRTLWRWDVAAVVYTVVVYTVFLVV